MIVPEGLWEIIGWPKRRPPTADDHALIQQAFDS